MGLKNLLLPLETLACAAYDTRDPNIGQNPESDRIVSAGWIRSDSLSDSLI
jgi:hypothetical protein